MSDDIDVDELQQVLDRKAREVGVPGAAVGIVHHEATMALTTGVASMAAPAPVTEHTLFMIGSTTKTVTATALLTLIDEGRLAFDTPVREILPDLPLWDGRVREQLTVRHLLTHRGGFEGDVADQAHWDRDSLARSVAAYGELAQYSTPGAAFSYSNAGFRLLGRMIEAITGESYEDAVAARVLEPLGMSESFFLPWEVFSRPHAVGHELDEDGHVSVSHLWGLGRSALPEGGLVSSVVDQLRYMRFHLDGTTASTSPLRDATRIEMQHPQAVAAPPFDAVGLPWLLVEMYGTTAVTHGGNVAGIQRSTMTLLPEQGSGVTVLANSGAGGVLSAAVTDWCFEHLWGGVPNRPRIAAPRRADELAPYCGRFDSGTWGMDISAEAGALKAEFFFTAASEENARRLPPPMTLVFCGDDEIMHPGSPTSLFGRFERDLDGAVIRLLCQGRSLRRVQKP